MIGGNTTAIGQFLLQRMAELFSGNSFRFHSWLLEIIFAQAKQKRCVYISAYIYIKIYTQEPFCIDSFANFHSMYMYKMHVQKCD